MSEQSEDRVCDVCFGRVDEDGESLGECSWVQPAACEKCGGCLCDGSC